MSEPPAQTTQATPILRLVRGEAAPEELAAVVALLAARAQPGRDGSAHDTRTPRGSWRDHAARLAGPHVLRAGPGPGAWRGSGLPR